MPYSKVLPQSRRDAVGPALQSAFGNWRAGDFHPLGGGVSGALIFRFEVRERPYVLRLEPDRIGLQDRQRHFACMVAAAEAGVAPPVHYADAADGVAIMGLVGGHPLSEYPGGRVGLVRALGALTARLQTAPPFPMLGDYQDMIATLLSGLRESVLFAAGQLDAHAEGLAHIRAALPWEAPLLNVAQSLTGPIALSISLIALMVAGGTLVFGGELSEFARRCCVSVLAIAFLVFGAGFMTALFGGGGAVVF